MTIFIEAMHTVRPLTAAAFDHYVDWYGNAAIPAMHRSGFEVLGAWKRTGGLMGRDVLLVRFEDMAAYERARAALRSDAQFLDASARRGNAFEIAEEVKICGTVPYASERSIEKALSDRPDKPRQYLQTIRNAKPTMLGRAYELAGHLHARLEATGVALVAAYETQVGQRGEFTDLSVVTAGTMDLSYRAGSDLDDLVAPFREVVSEESSYFLNPLPYSPLQ